MDVGKKEKNKWFILIVCILFVFVFILCFLLFKKSDSNIYDKTKNGEVKEAKVLSRLEKKASDDSASWPIYNENPSSNLTDNVSLKDSLINIDGDLVVLSKNLNNVYTEIDVKVSFKDKDGNEIKQINTYPVYYNKATDFISIFSSVSFPEEFDSYVISYDVKEAGEYFYKNYSFEDIKVVGSDDGKNISAKIENLSKEESYSPKICVVYFLEDKLKDASCLTDLFHKSSITTELKFENYYFNKKYKGFDFDSYKVIVNNL